MREILFRGKRKEHDFFGIGGEWVYGIPIRTHIGTFICFEENPHYCNQYGYMEIEEISKVIPETVGQFTGLTDKNGNKIFEGDIIAFEDETPGQYEYHDSLFINRGVIRFDDGQFYFTNSIAATMDDLLYKGTLDCEVIGNIHDNPELLEVNNE